MDKIVKYVNDLQISQVSSIHYEHGEKVARLVLMGDSDEIVKIDNIRAVIMAGRIRVNTRLSGTTFHTDSDAVYEEVFKCKVIKDLKEQYLQCSVVEFGE